MTVLLATLLGLCVGSFANVFLHRFPAGRSLWRPGSACPHCGHAIRARHNLPVLGWLLLAGRCYDCGASIRARYPLIEGAFGVLAGLSTWRLGSDLLALEFTGYFLALLLIAVVDWESLHIYDVCTYPLGLAGLSLSVQFPGVYGAWWVSAACAAGTLALMWALGAAGTALFKRDALGGGDVKLMAAAAGFLGPAGIIQALAFSVVLGLPLMLVYQRRRGLGWREPAPFGPGLCLGCALAGWDLVSGDLSWALGRAGLQVLDLRNF